MDILNSTPGTRVFMFDRIMKVAVESFLKECGLKMTDLHKMCMIYKLSLIIAVVLFTVSIGSAEPSTTATTIPPSVPVSEAADDSMPFDPFDDDVSEYDGDGGERLISVADPLAGFNRAMFIFTDKLYFLVLKPVASGYRYVMPTPVRIGIKNFFFNLLTPVRLVNCLLQGKCKAAGGELGRFFINSTVGMLGFLNPAKAYPELNPPEEDLGQTLGYYGIGNGFYIFLPLLGPSTLCDTIGSIGDWALNPFSFMQLVHVDAGALTSGTTNAMVFGVRTVNDTSFLIGDWEYLKSIALDPYEALRNGYLQKRVNKIAQ